MGEIPLPAIHLVRPHVEHRDKVRTVRPGSRKDKGGVRSGRFRPEKGEIRHRERKARCAERHDAGCGGQAQGQDAVRGLPYLLYRRFGNRAAHQERPHRKSNPCLYQGAAYYPEPNPQLSKGDAPQNRVGRHDDGNTQQPCRLLERTWADAQRHQLLYDGCPYRGKGGIRGQADQVR